MIITKSNDTRSRQIVILTILALFLMFFLARGILFNLSSDAKSSVIADSEYRFSSEDLDGTLWLLHGNSSQASPHGVYLALELPEDSDCALLMSSSLADGLTVNGNPVHPIRSGSYALISLPESTELVLSFSRDRDRVLYSRNESLYFGSTERIQEKLASINTASGVQEGFFLFSILFSLSLYLFKPTEKYLLFFAMHACTPRLLGSGSLLVTWFPTVVYGLSLVEQSYIYQYAYILITGAIHWLIYREFVIDRIGKYPYIVYLAISAVFVTLFATFFADIRESGIVSHLLYLTMYFLEGFVLIRGRYIQEQQTFAPLLIAGWFFSLIFWTVRAANNLGYIVYPYSIGTYVALGYTVSFLLCISGKFARKYTQADRLLLRTQSLNEELSELNDSLEQKVEERTAALQQAVEELERTQAAKSALMTNIIHNLKTPLFSLKGYAELLKEEKEQARSDDPDIPYLTHICSNVDYLQDMVRQLLLYDRLEEKKITFHIVRLSLAGMLSRLESAEYASLHAKGITLRISNETEPSFTLYADEFYLKQAIICILDNAIRYSSENSFIDLHAISPAPGLLSLIITDYGAGMSPSVCEHIFDRGYSHHENGEKSSGLGLNIALEIVREHGGTISVHSKEGAGSSFRIELPICSDGKSISTEEGLNT